MKNDAWRRAECKIQKDQKDNDNEAWIPTLPIIIEVLVQWYRFLTRISELAL